MFAQGIVATKERKSRLQSSEHKTHLPTFSPLRGCFPNLQTFRCCLGSVLPSSPLGGGVKFFLRRQVELS